MSDDKPLKNLDTMSPDAPAEARRQASKYDSVFATTPLTLDDGTVIQVPPHPNLQLLDEDAQAAIDKLNVQLESYDREPDIFIPEQTVKDRSGNDITLPAETKPGPYKLPHRKTDPNTGEAALLDPPYRAQIARFALGEEDYVRLRAGTVNGRRGSTADVWRIWSGQATATAERQKNDLKSDGRAVDSASVPAPDPS